MKYLSPIVVFIIAAAGIFIFTRFAKKLFFFWLIITLIELAILVAWPEGLEHLANFISILRAIIIKS